MRRGDMKLSVLFYVPNLIGKCHRLCVLQAQWSPQGSKNRSVHRERANSLDGLHLERQFRRDTV